MCKNIFFLLFLNILLSSPLYFSQPAFPLETGNKWYYEITYQFYNPPRPPSNFTFEVIGDTVMSNGKQFWILDPYDMFHAKYIRSDSNHIYYWDSFCNSGQGCEVKTFNINASLGIDDTINWSGYMFATLNQIYQSSLFNNVIVQRQYSLGGLIFADLGLSEKFGYTNFTYMGDYQSERDIWNLKGCLISDTLYGEMTGLKAEEDVPEEIFLYQNYPNPFNSATTIKYSIISDGHVKLEIFDVFGQLAEVVVNSHHYAGNYDVQFDSGALSSGIYFYKLTAGRFTDTKKMTLLK